MVDRREETRLFIGIVERRCYIYPAFSRIDGKGHVNPDECTAIRNQRQENDERNEMSHDFTMLTHPKRENRGAVQELRWNFLKPAQAEISNVAGGLFVRHAGIGTGRKP